MNNKPPAQFPVLVPMTLATVLLTTLLLVRISSGSIWRGINLFAIIQREEINLVGYLAAGLVLATFCMRSMTGSRSMALASNLAFIVYSYLADLMPVLLLHAILLPVNAYRLAQLLGADFRPE